MTQSGPDNQPLDLARLETVLWERLQFVAITADPNDNVHRIFESLNDRGVRLTQADLLRNYVFMLLPTRAEHVFEHIWRPMQDSLTATQLETLVFVDLILRGQTTIKRPDIYRAQQNGLRPIEGDEGAVGRRVVVTTWGRPTRLVTVHRERRAEIGTTGATGKTLVSGPIHPATSCTIVTGSRYAYFGHDEWRQHAVEVKSLESALAARSRLLGAFEAAEMEPDAERRKAWLTFVVVGAGPTGVEMSGQIAELARNTLRRDFRAIDPRSGRILLVEMADRVLTTFPPTLSAKAARSLHKLGVTVLTRRTVTGIDGDSVTIDGGSDRSERIPTRTVIWAAGVTASGLASRLAELTGAERDRAGRVTVERDLTLPGHREVFALGDMVRVRGADGAPIVLPGVAPVAMQQGRYAAKVVRARLRSSESPPFRYRDKGNLATIGRARAVADIKRLKLSGFLAWVIWLVVQPYLL
jgi:NADH dehydrogenase FAD-containing subunit